MIGQLPVPASTEQRVAKGEECTQKLFVRRLGNAFVHLIEYVRQRSRKLVGHRRHRL